MGLDVLCRAQLLLYLENNDARTRSAAIYGRAPAGATVVRRDEVRVCPPETASLWVCPAHINTEA